MKKKRNLFPTILISKEDLYLNFEKENYDMIIVTGITGSGKSYTSNLLKEKYHLPIICFDHIYGYQQDREKNELEQTILNQFINKYPKYKDAKKLIKYGRKVKEQIKEINDNFYDFVLNYLKQNHLKIIFDGACFCNDVSYNKFKNQRIIVKRTSFLKTIIQRMNRCIKRSKGKKHRITIFLKDIKYIILHLKEWYNALDGFLYLIDKEANNK